MKFRFQCLLTVWERMAVEGHLPHLVAPTAAHATTTMQRTKTTGLVRTQHHPTWIVTATALWLWIVRANAEDLPSRMSAVCAEATEFLLEIVIAMATNSML